MFGLCTNAKISFCQAKLLSKKRLLLFYSMLSMSYQAYVAGKLLVLWRPLTMYALPMRPLKMTRTGNGDIKGADSSRRVRDEEMLTVGKCLASCPASRQGLLPGLVVPVGFLFGVALAKSLH